MAEVDRGKVTRIADTNEWLSLGEIVTRTGSIPLELEDLIIKTFQAFQRLSRLHRASHLYMFATEAMRKASNGQQVLADLAKKGIAIDLIDGRREAEFGLRGAWLDCNKETDNLLMVETGGGSAQVAFAKVTEGRPEIVDERSLPLGTGALIGKLGLTQPANKLQIKELREAVREELAPVFEGRTNLGPIIGVGGVARGVWRALHPDGNRRIHAQELDYLIWATSRLTEAEITARFNVKLRRALTLLPGAVVYRTILECTGRDQLRISRFGVREGAILEMAEGRLKPCRL